MIIRIGKKKIVLSNEPIEIMAVVRAYEPARAVITIIAGLMSATAITLSIAPSIADIIKTSVVSPKY